MAPSPRTPAASPAVDALTPNEILEEAAAQPEAAVRFLQAIGYRELVPVCVEQNLSLLALTRMSIPDIENRLGVESRKTAVAFYDELLKLRGEYAAMVAANERYEHLRS